MLLHTVSRSILNRRFIRCVALLLVPLLLYAQGLRLCLHADTAEHLDRGLTVHLESNLSTVADHDTLDADVDVSLAMLIKTFHSTLILVLAFALISLLYLPRRLAGRISPPEFRFPSSAVYSLTPPLRAPPR